MGKYSFRRVVFVGVLGFLGFCGALLFSYKVGLYISKSDMESKENEIRTTIRTDQPKEIPVKPDVWIDQEFIPWGSAAKGIKNFELSGVKVVKFEPSDKGYLVSVSSSGGNENAVEFELRSYFTSVDMVDRGDYDHEIDDLKQMFKVGDNVRIRGQVIPIDSELTADIARDAKVISEQGERYEQYLGNFGDTKIPIEELEQLLTEGGTLPNTAILIYGFDNRSGV